MRFVFSFPLLSILSSLFLRCHFANLDVEVRICLCVPYVLLLSVLSLPHCKSRFINLSNALALDIPHKRPYISLHNPLPNPPQSAPHLVNAPHLVRGLPQTARVRPRRGRRPSEERAGPRWQTTRGRCGRCFGRFESFSGICACRAGL
jgi:hypothetical protein